MDQGSSVPLVKSLFGMIPLPRHSVDRSPRAFHFSTHNVVRASCSEVLTSFVESRKLFMDGSLWLAGHWPWSGCLGSTSWKQRSELLAVYIQLISYYVLLNKKPHVTDCCFTYLTNHFNSTDVSCFTCYSKAFPA